ncbi:FAD-dependent monooxygenase [Brevibacterium pigmentatum]|uniref:FAD-dependent monooxygenase n=1 Tax=Brevibacterium pigmentatum TaxID=1496080 RepID=UPI0014206D18|nr:FAD-dependent monooxygenase [Brevibacterium pigmentatum]
MQFHLNGFRPGDPDIHPAVDIRPNELTTEADVLIVGTGPAGLVLAAQLAAFPDISVRIVERRERPLELGHADGIMCRTVETFNAFGLADGLVREAYGINETAFWGPDGDGPARIVRTGLVDDVPEGMTEFPHVVLNQARVQDYLLEHMANSPSRLEPEYGIEAADITIADSGSHPVTVTVRRTGDDASAPVSVRAKYVVGCDGARTAVRRALGIGMTGDEANHAWGVMDVLAVTDFPDVRRKSVIQSAADGNALLIPREGGYLIRLYVDLGELDPFDPQARSRFTIDAIIEAAQRIFRPYRFDVKEIAWWSVYEVGQRIAERFDDVPDEERGARTPRVFIAGDACHTHSAKAGQGMNVSIQDSFNLGWKLAAVLQGRSPARLLRTYDQERREVAQSLIDFDLKWSAAMASRPSGTEDSSVPGMSSAERQQLYTESARFTSGFATDYPPNMITGTGDHEDLAKGFPVGERFHSAPVIRLADARPVEIGHQAEADGRWRIYLFADSIDPRSSDSAASRLCEFLAESSDSPVVRATPAAADPDSSIDVRAVFQADHRDLDITQLPPLLRPRKGRYGLIDYEKVFCTGRGKAPDIFDQRRVNRRDGAIVVVRPDQYVAEVLPLDGVDRLKSFFTGILCDASDARTPTSTRLTSTKRSRGTGNLNSWRNSAAVDCAAPTPE